MLSIWPIVTQNVKKVCITLFAFFFLIKKKAALKKIKATNKKGWKFATDPQIKELASL